jgi:hypothetical protein
LAVPSRFAAIPAPRGRLGEIVPQPNFALVAAPFDIETGQLGAPLMFAYLPDVLTCLAFGIVMAACLSYVDGSPKNDAD